MKISKRFTQRHSSLIKRAPIKDALTNGNHFQAVIFRCFVWVYIINLEENNYRYPPKQKEPFEGSNAWLQSKKTLTVALQISCYSTVAEPNKQLLSESRTQRKKDGRKNEAIDGMKLGKWAWNLISDETEQKQPTGERPLKASWSPDERCLSKRNDCWHRRCSALGS